MKRRMCDPAAMYEALTGTIYTPVLLVTVALETKRKNPPKVLVSLAKPNLITGLWIIMGCSCSVAVLLSSIFTLLFSMQMLVAVDCPSIVSGSFSAKDSLVLLIEARLT